MAHETTPIVSNFNWPNVSKSDDYGIDIFMLFIRLLPLHSFT